MQALVEYLPDLAPDWHFTFLRHSSHGARLSLAPNVSEIELRAGANSPTTMWWLPRMVEFDRFDLFHGPANILPRGVPIPCVTTIHDIMWLDDPALCKPGLKRRIQGAFYRHGIRRALDHSAALVTVSEATRRAILAHRPELAERIFTAPPGVSNRFRPHTSCSDRLPNVGTPISDYVLTVGQSAPYKNHVGAVRGFAAAFADRPEIHLIIVQRQGAGASQLTSLAHDLGVGGRVHCLSPQDDDALAALYAGALALLHPSLCEGFGMPLAEAMASGCPIVTSNVSAMPEVTAGAALLVDPRDPATIGAALRRILDEPGLAVSLRERGLVRARQMDRRKFAQANLEIYRRILAGS